jgi:anti-anti-sigma regulatory factor
MADQVPTPLPFTGRTSSIIGLPCKNGPHSYAGRARPARRRPPPGTLDLSIQRRSAAIELVLTGDLDMATSPRLGEAMAWLRFSGPAATIVIDTGDLDFVAAAGYGALQAALAGPDGRKDPRVALIVGPAVARIEAAISASSISDARPGLSCDPRDVS